MFVGTEFGLYVSLDGGQNWNSWKNNLPTMPITDLVIHPRDHDLVIGTFGRAIWIMDDIQSLRELAARGSDHILNKELHLFPIADAHLMMIGESIGYRHGKIGDALYNGENRAYGALLTYYLEDIDGDSMELSDKVKFDIVDKKGQVVRTFYQEPKKGINRINWNLRLNAPRPPQVVKPQKEIQPGDGFYAAPGAYEVRMSYNGLTSSRRVQVHPDPRLDSNQNRINEKMAMIHKQNGLIERATASMDRLREIETKIEMITQLLKINEKDKRGEIEDIIKETLSTISRLKKRCLGEEVQGIRRDPTTVRSLISVASYLLDHPLSPVTENQKLQQDLLEAAIEQFEQDQRSFESNELNTLKGLLKTIDLSFFE